MPGPFLATITIHQDLSQPVDPGYGVPAPPGGGGAPGVPTHPIYNPPVPTHPIVLPPEEPGGPPDVIWPSPGHPAHPIVLPPEGSPPGIWGGGNVPMPTPPIYLPPVIWPEPPDGGPPVALPPIGAHPEHPIVLPQPPGVWPPDAHVEHPIVLPLPPEIWPSPGHPAHPIVIPPEDPERRRLFTWKVGWSEKTGWVVVAIPNFPHPAPAAAKAQKAT